MPTTYTRISAPFTALTECEFYDCLMEKCCYQCSAGWVWERSTDAVRHTGQVWKEIFADNPPACDCDDPACPSGREVAYLNLITAFNLSGFGGNRINATLSSATYINNEVLVPPTPVYTIDWGDGSPTQTLTIGIPLQHLVGALANDIYKGTVTWEGAQLDFWYIISGGNATEGISNRTSSFSYDLSCSLYPDYTIDVGDSSTIFGGKVFDGIQCFVFLNIIYDEVLPNVATYTEGGQLLYDGTQLADLINFGNNSSDPSVGSMNNVGLFRSQCVE